MESFKYLIRIPNHLGDAIMALPAVKAFVKLNSNKKIALLLPAWAAPLYQNITDADLILLPSNSLHGLVAILFQIKLLRKYKIENGVLLTPSFSSALVLFLAGIKNRYGYVGDNRSIFLNRSVNLSVKETIHRSAKYKFLLEKAGEKKLITKNPQVNISDLQRMKATALLEQFGLNQTDKYLVIAPRAIAESRRWGTDNYSSLARKVIDNYDLKIVLVGTADQFDPGQRIAGDERKIVNLCGKTNIEQAASILSGALLFIGNDSGLAHLSSAVNIPLLILSGADNPEETSPISDKKTVIIKSTLDCISCVKNSCPKGGDEYMLCMKKISVDEVFESASLKIKSHI